jgi:hypothetical protein
MMATNKKLIHQGERNNTANNDFSEILNFTRNSAWSWPQRAELSTIPMP